MRTMMIISIILPLLCVAIKDSSLSQQSYEYDIIFKNGHVIDPANNIDKVCDIAVKDGKIAIVKNTIEASKAKRVANVSGLYLSPGFIDIHTHVYGGLVADHHNFNSGVTTVVGAGTVGASNFEQFKEIIDKSRVRILSLLNISEKGMLGNNDPTTFDVDLAVETALKYPDIIVGFKSVRYSYWHRLDEGLPLYDTIHTPWASVDSTQQAGIRAGLPTMHHFDPEPAHDGRPARTQREFLLEKLRPGDMYTHCFRRKHPVIMDDGTLNPDFVEAQKKGIIFDIGHGANSFVYRNAIPAIRQGFLPNSISTDIHGGNVNDVVINMLHVMSKCLNIGMTLEDVIRCSTINPAQQINRPELGSLTVGNPADIAVFDVEKGDFTYLDITLGYSDEGSGGTIKGDRKMVHMMTVFGGAIVSDPYGLSFPQWEDIPGDDDYWKSHGTGLKVAPKDAYVK